MPKSEYCRLFFVGLFLSQAVVAGCRAADAPNQETPVRAQAGTESPDVTLKLQDGRSVRLADYRGERAVVLFFYPKDNTPVCTAEACSFRDAYDDLAGLDAEVIGVSGDTAASHQKFAEKYNLPFPLASDADGAVRRAFGVPQTLGFLPGRTT